MKTWHLHITGQVQGIGFRPHVMRVAKRKNITGRVSNKSDGVHVLFNASENTASAFANELIHQGPVLARVSSHSLKKIARQSFEGFQIADSTQEDNASLLITPDLAMCANCQEELHDHHNRRYRYPFITCTQCGPRFSLIRSLPFDRERTTMAPFTMCIDCYAEYVTVEDRRFHAQTNSCPNCPVPLALFRKGKFLTDSPGEILTLLKSALDNQQIIAIKGVGGYQLLADASDPMAIRRLREIKSRPTKPFAVMIPDLEWLKKQTPLAIAEAQLLADYAAPIVTIHKDGLSDEILSDAISPGQTTIGLMLPNTPLHDLLLSVFEKPFVATSANLSGAAIIHRDADALEELGPLTDLVLTFAREILIPQDDSVIRLTPIGQKSIFLRRARGYAPTLMNSLPWPQSTKLGCGAMLKSTFSYLSRGNVYVSQYFGDLWNYSVYQNYQFVINHFLSLFGQDVEHILVDLHSGYPSHEWGNAYAGEKGITVETVQHHLAHFAAVLGENDLIETNEAVLGVIWDGAGLGSDRQIWGGEFFCYQNLSFKRVAHLQYFDHLLGDKMAREPRIALLAALGPDRDKLESEIISKFAAQEWSLYSRMLNKKMPGTSSMGRIFDAVACLIGVSNRQSYEGEAAQMLEALATSYFVREGLPKGYPEKLGLPTLLSPPQILSSLAYDLQRGDSREVIAARFHLMMVQLIELIADQQEVTQLAFSGGVFQNGLLVDLINHLLSKKYKLYFHKHLSPNDESISFGQLVFSSFCS